jgi:tetratricopeptide (TPR) repeat protein
LNSLLAGLLAIIGLATLPQSVPERVATALAAAALALVPMADGRLVELTEFVGSDAHTLMRAQYFQCDGDCRGRLASTLREDPADTETAYTAALAGIRAGTKREVAHAEAILQKAAAPPEQLRGRWLNLKGAVALASGQTDRAIEHLEEASKIRPGSGTIWFNLMRAYRMAGRNDPASEASHNASANDVEAVRKRSSMNRRDPPSYLLLPPLPAGHFLDQHFNRPPTEGASLLRPVWQTIAGPSLSLRSAPFLGGGLFAIVLLGGVGRRFGLFSSPCPNCGLAREPEDPSQTGGHPHCLPCYRTFVGGAELGYRARVHYETLLGRRSNIQSYLRRILSIVTPGGGHALAGRPFSALAIAASIAFGLVLALHPDWLWSPPAALGPANWLAGGWLGWLPAGLGLLVALRSGWEDITPYERSD